MTASEMPWWDVAMQVFLVFGVVVIVVVLAMVIVVASRMVGVWWGRRRLVKSRERRDPFKKDPRRKWPYS